MKKFVLKSALITLSAFFTLSPASANTFTSGKEFIEVRQAPSAQKEVVEFFSFYCPHCYNFEVNYKIPSQMKDALPENAAFKQYHVNFLGRESANLTRAWALAMALSVEEQVKMPLFEAAQKNEFQSMDDIRAVFLANGISAEQFDGGINSFAVNGLVNKQLQAAEELRIRSVPTFLVNDQYQINSEDFPEVETDEDFIKLYIDVMSFLLNKDK